MKAQLPEGGLREDLQLIYSPDHWNECRDEAEYLGLLD